MLRLTPIVIALAVLFAASSPPARADQPAPSDVKTPSDTLTFVTYNVLADRADADRRIPALLKLLENSDADVIALQEVTPWFLDRLFEAEWPTDLYHSPLIEDRAAGGLFIMSRHPIARSNIQPIPTRQGRTLLMVEIRLGDERLRIVTAHLESPLELHRTRAAQLKVANQLLDGADHAVLLGDMNFSKGWQPETDAVKAYRDAWRDVHRDASGYTWNIEASAMAQKGSFPGEKSGRIDRVLYRSEVWRTAKAKIIGNMPLVENSRELFPSDHFGLHVTLTRRDKKPDADE